MKLKYCRKQYTKEEVVMKKFRLTDIDVRSFVKALDAYKGNVMLISSDEDRFSTKSRLNRYSR